MKSYLYIAFSILLAFLQISFFSSFVFFGATVNVVLVMVLALIITKDMRSAYFAALASGLILDVHSHMIFGIITLLLLAIVFISNLVLKSFLEHSTIFAKVAIAVMATLGFTILQFLLLSVFNVVGFIDLHPTLTVQSIVSLCISAVLNALLLFVIVKGVLFFNMYFDKREFRSNSLI